MSSDHTDVVQSKLGPLEKVGYVILRWMGPTCPLGVGVDDQHVLSEDEQKRLKSIARWTVFRAGAVGAFFALLIAFVAVFADGVFSENKILYWVVFGGCSMLGAVLEVGFLYYDALVFLKIGGAP